MNPYPKPVTLFSRDPRIAERLHPLLDQHLDLRVVDTYPGFCRLMDQIGPAVVLLDLRLPEESPDLREIVREWPDPLFIALGRPRSAPMCVPAIEDMYAAEDVDIDPPLLLNLVRRAQQHLDLREENRRLKRENAERRRPQPATPPPSGGGRLFSTRELIRIIRCMDDVEALQERLLDEVAISMKLSRAGIVLRKDRGRTYTLRAGWMLLPEARGVTFTENDPFVRWIERHAHVVSRASIDLISHSSDRMMLERVLDRLGAELILPLRGRGGILGWFFTGHPLSGKSFDGELMDQLILATDLMAVSLESALLYREVNLQKTLAESLLNELPVGIVYADAEGRIRWYSPVADRIMGAPGEPKVGRELDALDPHVCEVCRDVLPPGDESQASRDWRDTATGRPLRATAIRIGAPDRHLGILVMLEDRTLENTLKEKQNRLERNEFWNQLAASMSHEVRNPLVSIKTFAQLLPDRYQDEEFRTEFSRLVGTEIDRLNGMIEQLNGFAHPRKFAPELLDVRQPVRDGITRFNQLELETSRPDVQQDFEPGLPMVRGDAAALTETVEHLLRNTAEAMPEGGHVRVGISAVKDLQLKNALCIDIEDHGPGIPHALKEHVFSPFCTSKARGLGLGLSIAQRTMADHGGRIEVKSGPRGTRVSLWIPAVGPGGEL